VIVICPISALYNGLIFFRHVPVRKIGRAEPLQPDIAQKAHGRDGGKISPESRRSVSKKTYTRKSISNVFTATQG